MLQAILEAATAFRTDRDLHNGQAWEYHHVRLAELGGWASLEIHMNRSQFVGGIICLIAAALIFIFGTSDYSIYPAIVLMIVGVGLTATARKR